MKVLVLGNCQSEYLAKLLDNSKKLNVTTIKPVHLLNVGDFDDIKHELKDTDVLVTQLLTDNYRNMPIGTNQIDCLLHSTAKKIVVPNMHFEGYFPSFCYLRDLNGKAIGHEDDSRFYHNYHDAFLCLASRIEAPISEILSIYSSLQLEEYALKSADKSFKELRAREEACDVFISDYIADNFKKRQLFWTFNHPANELFYELTNRILYTLGIKDIDFDHSEQEFLDSIKLPVFDFVINSLNINFKSDNSQFFDTASDLLTAYRKSPEVLQHNLKINSNMHVVDSYFNKYFK